MAKDLRSLIKNKTVPQDAPDDLKKKISELEKKSEPELMAELSKSIEAGKKDGSFTPEALSQFKNKVAPMLSAEQRARMEDILKRIDR